MTWHLTQWMGSFPFLICALVNRYAEWTTVRLSRRFMLLKNACSYWFEKLSLHLYCFALWILFFHLRSGWRAWMLLRTKNYITCINCKRLRAGIRLSMRQTMQCFFHVDQQVILIRNMKQLSLDFTQCVSDLVRDFQVYLIAQSVGVISQRMYVFMYV